MKKVFLSTMLLSSLFLGGSIVAQAADEEGPNKAGTNKDQSTDVQIRLTDDSTPEVTDGPFKGALAIVYYPTTYNFEGKLPSTAEANQQLSIDNKIGKPTSQNIVVNDDRRDKDNNTVNQTWELKAALSEIKKSDGTSTLEGAKLTLTPNGAYQYNIGDGTNKKQTSHGEDYEPNEAPKKIDGTALGEHFKTEESVVLNAGEKGAKVIMSHNEAEKGDTSSENRGAFTNLSNAKLSLLATNKTGNYKGSVNWTLASEYTGEKDNGGKTPETNPDDNK